MRRVLAVLGILVMGYLIVATALYLFQRNLLYLPDRSIPNRQASGVGDMAEVRVRTADGLDLLAWYRAAASVGPVGRPTIIYFHGNGGHIGYRGGRVRTYLDAGFGVLLVEYRGYGGNPGRPSEPGLALDAAAALAFLDAAGVAPERTVVYGESLGASVAVTLAADQAASGRPVGAVVLEAPPSSITDVAAYHYPWLPVRWLLTDRFEATQRIAAIAAPLLIVHGEADQVVPVHLGRALFAAAGEPKEAAWIADARHENLAAFGMQRRVFDYLARRLDGGIRQTP